MKSTLRQPHRRSAKGTNPKGLRQFLSDEQQNAWLNGDIRLEDAEERDQSFEQRLRYTARFEKLLRRPQAQDVFLLLRQYADHCLPVPRMTERWYWSVSCLPSTNDKPLVRVNTSWMELFTLLPNGDGLRARFILHASDFVRGETDVVDEDLLARCTGRPEDVSHHGWGSKDILVVKIRSAASIRHFMLEPYVLRAIRRFNLSHMNRGRNAYQASHSFQVADEMLGD